MKTSLRISAFLFALFAVISVNAQNLLHYWNFNNSATLESILMPASSEVDGASISQVVGSSEIQITSNTGQDFDLENLNARNGDEAGSHLRFNLPIGSVLQFDLPTTGYKDAVVNYVTRRSGSGAGLQYIAYSTNGVDFTAFDTIVVTETPTLISLDFSDVSEADNNPEFAIQISFDAGSGSTGGNNRFDNFTVDATIQPVLALLHYWNFNNSATLETLTTPSYTEVGGASIAQIAGGISQIQITSNTGQDFDIENLNARFGDVAGSHLRFNDPIGGGLLFNINTSGYEDVTVKYVTRRSGSGAGTQLIAYTTDGVNFTDFTTVGVTETPTLITLDFSGIAEADNNPNFAVRYFFEAGAGGTVGNNRFDNYTVEGFSTGAEDTAPPVVTFSPANNAQNLPVNTIPVITFNEAVQLAGGVALTPENINTAVELRLNDENGALVDFTAAYTGNDITVTPVGGLLNGQTYYIAVLAGSITDLSGNALETTRTSVFSTIAVQTVFNPGDLAIVAYRMNTSDIDDQFAFITFVDILPGTLIYITDAKYTSNAQAQCVGGLVWTAPEAGVPANTVVLINNDNGTTDTGSLSGSGFGLSSGGDQIFMYTGGAADAVHITALSSNAWIENATSCSGSLSQIPANLEDGVSAINLSTAPDAVSGLLVNGYYNGPQDLAPAAQRLAIFDPANWVGTGSGTTGQIWPAWAFGSTPAVVSATVVNQTTIQVLFNRALEQSSAEDLANYTGIEGLASATLTEVDGTARLVVLSYSQPFASAVAQTLTVDNVLSAGGEPMAAPFVFNFTYNTSISFAEAFVSVNEDAGVAILRINVVNPASSSFDIAVKGSPWSTADANDFSLLDSTIFVSGSTGSIDLIIPINEDNEGEQDEYLAIYIENEQGLSVTGTRFATLYIKDNDRLAPVASRTIELSHVGSFNPDTNGSSTVEVIAYDPASQRIFATSAIENRLDIVDFSDPAALNTIASVDMTPYGGITGVATKNGIVAVASPNADEQLDGSVVFFDIDGNFLNQITAGALPDMVTFSPDGTKVLTANEGQPNNAYTIDPEGSVTVIDIGNGIASLTQNDAQTLLFSQFNADEAALIALGVRKTFASSTLSQDLEPEFIAISEDGNTAWISCQENNAVATLDLTTNTYTALQALGTKDYNAFGNGFDASDNSGAVHISNWPINGFFIPDAMASYEVNGERYLVTANEGDEKEYGPLNERTTVGAGSTILDSIAFPHADFLKASYNLGRLRISNIQGDTDGDGDYDELYAVGARSFSIFNAETMELVYDSGDDFEQITAADPVFGAIFNCDNENNNFKSRSRAKGPEPEGITVAKIKGRTYSFITLERIGGVMVYDITDPTSVEFVDYKNTRDPNAFGGDNGPEYVIYLDPSDSPDGKAYALVSNEISGTITVFEVLGASPDPCRYFMSDYNAQGGSDVYEITLDENENTADLSLLVSVPQRVNLAFDNASNQLYLGRESNSVFQTLNPDGGTLSLPIGVNVGLSGFMGAAFGPDGKLYAASGSSQGIYRFNPATFQGEYVSAGQIQGGDIAFTTDGELILVSRSPARAFLVNENGANTILGPVPAGVSGLARRGDGTFLLSVQGLDQLIAGSTTEGDLGVRFDLKLNGAPFTPANGDLASGCPVPAAAMMVLTDTNLPVNAVEASAKLASQPNPTEGISIVTFTTDTGTRATLEVYDVSGRSVATLFNAEVQPDQEYRAEFNGAALPNGVYIYRLTTDAEVVIEKFMIAR